MKILLSWLNEYVDGGFAAPTDAAAVTELADLMTSIGLEVEKVTSIGETVAGVVSARVLRTEQHPDAAKVQRVWVDAGTGTELHVWCGASNFAAGDIVPLATLGTTMPNGMTIERRGILGIDSEGMLCAAGELELHGDDTGILLLPADAEIGVPYGEVLGIEADVLITLNLERNRPDCWGYVGVARDIAAKLNRGLIVPAANTATTGPPRQASVELAAGAKCPRFTATVMSGVTIGPSPAWMQTRLGAAGMRPINNVVDVSNYVMLELNQPNHAYDLETLGGNGFKIRLAQDGEQLTTLDKTTRQLTEDDVLICDAIDTPIGLAGVMGGFDTEITEQTTTLALEVAWFEPHSVRQAAQRHGLRSEASARFERGVDPCSIEAAIARFAELLGETCPDLVVHAGGVDARVDGLPAQHRSVDVPIDYVNRLLSTNLTSDDLPGLLDKIGYTVSGSGDPRTVALPTWRPDSTAAVDVIEEIGRMYGYDNVGKRVPLSPIQGGLSPYQSRRRLLRQVLLGAGISEAMPNPFLAPDTLAKAGLDGPTITLTNPLVIEESVLRTSLRPGMLQAIAYNESHRTLGVKLFEIGHIYPPGEGELPDEHEMLCVVLAGESAPAAVEVWNEIAAALGVGARIDQSRPPAGLHATRSATLQSGRDPSGAVGEVDPAVLKQFGVTERVAILELNLTELLGRTPKPANWKPVSRFPSSDLDLAFVLDNSVPADKLAAAIRQGAQPYLVALELFDTYRGGSLDDQVRSLAYRLRLQAADRNLTDDDVASILKKVVASATKLGAELRNQ